MDNNCHIRDFVHVFSYVENGRLNRVLKLTKPLTWMSASHIKFHYIDNDVWTKQTDMIGKNVKKGVQPSTLCNHPSHYKTNKYVSKTHKKEGLSIRQLSTKDTMQTIKATTFCDSFHCVSYVGFFFLQYSTSSFSASEVTDVLICNGFVKIAFEST